MELEERVSELERRLEALVGERPDAPAPTGADFWALEGLKQQLEGVGAAGGGVLYTGAVRLPTGERYEWQYGALTEQLLDGGDGDPDEARDAGRGAVRRLRAPTGRISLSRSPHWATRCGCGCSGRSSAAGAAQRRNWPRSTRPVQQGRSTTICVS